MKFSYKVFQKEKLLAVCDNEILGKTLKHIGIDIYISPDFYGSGKADENTIINLAKQSTIINAFGNNIIKILIKAGVIDNNSTVEIDGVLHGQVFVIA